MASPRTLAACAAARPKAKWNALSIYVETNLLNGRTFRSLEHLNEVTAWWLAEVADVRVHRETKQRPLDRHAEELPHLIPLPAASYHVAVVDYRVVNVEGDIVYRQNLYSVPWRHIGQALPVRITETELIVYGPKVDEVARHRLFPHGVTRQRSVLPEHRPSAEPRQTEAMLRERFAELGPNATRFLDGLLAAQRYGRLQAVKVLALLATYARPDLAGRPGTGRPLWRYSLNAVERILAVQAQPKSMLDILADQDCERLASHLTDNPVLPRPTTDYPQLVEEPTDHGSPPETSNPDHVANEPPAADDDANRLA